jgi:hypothetical protein
MTGTDVDDKVRGDEGVLAGSDDDRPAGWYVSRVVHFPGEQVRALGLLGGVVTPSGATLSIGAPVERPTPLEDHVSYDATLHFPGLFPARLKVELVVARYGGSLAEIGLRPAGRVSQRRIGAERYFDAAWAVLDSLTRVEDATHVDGGVRKVVRRNGAAAVPARRFSRAS